jgi:hypothetical protein
MGAKNHKNFQSDRPESGGADRDMAREKSGIVERDKEQFAQQQAEKRLQARKAQPVVDEEDARGDD